MKLIAFEHIQNYRFLLTFKDGTAVECDLDELIGTHVSIEDISSARIDPEWGCLEFKGGQVDIAPKTLYRFSTKGRESQAA
jgi:hypothetical protein